LYAILISVKVSYNECILVAGTLIWKISDYTSKLAEAKTKEGMELVSPPFYTSQYGYKLQV
jgi:TNF receptor-associated factor 4